MWYDVITRQNYFIHHRDIISQHDGLAMGAPSSGLIAEFFLQHTENKHLARLAHKHRIIDYFRYVVVFLTAFSIRVSLISSKIYNGDDTPKDQHFFLSGILKNFTGGENV